MWCMYSLSAHFGASLLMYIAVHPTKKGMRIGCGKHSELRAEIVYCGNIQSIRTDQCPRSSDVLE